MSRRICSIALALAGVAAPPVAGAQRSVPAAAQHADTAQWRDASPHRSGFVPVGGGVQLHYLDWGGIGPAIVFLAGQGNTAHAFDDFAPRFTDRFHVVALTRRGFGESSHPAGGYDTRQLVEDIRVAIDRLHLGRVILIGHSIAGEELTRFAATYPDRVSKLVYLDAAYDRVALDSMFAAAYPAPLALPPSPVPEAADTATAAGYVAFVHRTRGVNIPEADIRARYRSDGWNEEITPAYRAIVVEHPDYARVRAPALAIYAVTDSVSQLEPWQRDDTAHATIWQEQIDRSAPLYAASRHEFRSRVAHSGVVELHGAHHWLFVSNADEVARSIRRFLAVP
jgi:pimeloyl-ACP methyl ester carboxylesterase